MIGQGDKDQANDKQYDYMKIKVYICKIVNVQLSIQTITCWVVSLTCSLLGLDLFYYFVEFYFYGFLSRICQKIASVQSGPLFILPGPT